MNMMISLISGCVNGMEAEEYWAHNLLDEA